MKRKGILIAIRNTLILKKQFVDASVNGYIVMKLTLT